MIALQVKILACWLREWSLVSFRGRGGYFDATMYVALGREHVTSFLIGKERGSLGTNIWLWGARMQPYSLRGSGEYSLRFSSWKSYSVVSITAVPGCRGRCAAVKASRLCHINSTSFKSFAWSFDPGWPLAQRWVEWLPTQATSRNKGM